MTTTARITARASERGVDAATVERDWVLAHVMSALGEHTEKARLVFKGGTALRLVHYPDYRYSADLDFSLTGGTAVEQGYDILAEVLAGVPERAAGLLTITLDTDRTPPRIVYTGPLGGERAAKLDLATDELVEEVEELPLLAIYDDVPDSTVVVYSLTEVASEKLRCIIQRTQCRDLYDIDRLTGDRDGVDLPEAWQRFERKARHKKIDPNRLPDVLDRRIDTYRRQWNTELEDYVGDGNVPHFDAVERGVRRALRPHFP